MLNDEQAKNAFYFLQRYRDRLATAINHEGLRDAREFRAVCKLLEELRPVLYPLNQGPPAGMADRRATPR